MEVDDEPDRNIEQFHVAEELSIVDGDDVLDTLQFEQHSVRAAGTHQPTRRVASARSSPVARYRARGRCRTARGSQVRRG